MSGPMREGVDLVKKLDEAFQQGGVPAIRETMQDIDPATMPADTAVLVLSGIREICVAVGGPLLEEYRSLTDRTIEALETVWD